jgi:hypothetical protein
MARVGMNMMCCGLREIADLRFDSDAKASLVSILSGYKPPDQKWFSDHGNLLFHRRKRALKRLGQFIFTQSGNTIIRGNRYGENFEEFIVTNGLGKVVRSAEAAPNHNYSKGHMIDVWIWTPDPKALWKWWAKNKPTDIVEIMEINPYWL